MWPLGASSCVVIITCCATLAGSVGETARVRLFLAEIEAGTMQSQQYCGVIFEDRRFHYEKASRRNGRDIRRKIYEGDLSESDWNTLTETLDNKELRGINVLREVPPLVIQDSHPYMISIARENRFQNIEFLDNRALKPYEPQLKPLLRWWKAFRKSPMVESNAAPDARCSTDNTHAVYNQ